MKERSTQTKRAKKHYQNFEKMFESTYNTRVFAIFKVASFLSRRAKERGLSQKLLIKRMAQPFAMQFSMFRQNKRKSLKKRQK